MLGKEGFKLLLVTQGNRPLAPAQEITMAKKLIVAMAALCLATAANSAFADDQITTTVTAPFTGSSAPLIINNAATNGTIQVIYTYTGSSLPCGAGTTFATFSLSLFDSAGTTGKSPTYPASLSFQDAQNGNGGPVQLSANPAGFSVSGSGLIGSPTVTVSLPDCSKIDPAYDGEEVNGMLNEATGTAHLQTISGVLVKIKLSIPSNTSCLQTYSFETDNDGNPLPSITVNANKFNSVKSTQPGEISVDTLIANNCNVPRTFDLKVNLDPGWSTNPVNNPGNAVFTFAVTGEIDPTTFNLAAFGTGTPQGQSLCLSNVSLAAGQSFLDVVHSQIDSGIPIGSLTPNAFGFNTTLYPAQSGCSGTATASANSTLPYTVK
jgi:hypothetical protein